MDGEAQRGMIANLCAVGMLSDRHSKYVLPVPVLIRGFRTRWDEERWDRDVAFVATAYRQALDAEARGELMLTDEERERIGRKAIAALDERRDDVGSITQAD